MKKEKSKDDKPTESHYARKTRAKRNFLKHGGTIEEWRARRKSGRIKI